VKHLSLIICFFTVSQVLLAQSDIPWELERFSSDHYTSRKTKLDAEPSASQNFSAYYQIYKIERAKKPEIYLADSSLSHHSSLNFLSDIEFDEELILLINFLETQNLRALQDLSKSAYEHEATLPYRFAAAMIEKDTEKATYYLDQMDKSGMISPVMKSWGFNASQVAGQHVYMTQGIQDLIALSWAFSETGSLGDKYIYNIYLNNISKEFQDENAFLISNSTAWISPALNASFFNAHVDNLRISGIGFKLLGSRGDAQTELDLTVEGFRGIGTECQNPADRGLVSSYRYFNDQLKTLSKRRKYEGLESFHKNLSKYIEKTIGDQ